jgi:hypothetical protein
MLGPQISNMAPNIWCLVMTKTDVSDHVLKNIEILKIFTEKLLLKQAGQKKFELF